LFDTYLTTDGDNADTIVEKVGIDNLLNAIEDYNEMATQRLNQNMIKYMEDRKTINPKIHEQFTTMVSFINDFYKEKPIGANYDGKQKVEENIQKFFQGDTVEEQLQSAKELLTSLHEIGKDNKEKDNKEKASTLEVGAAMSNDSGMRAKENSGGTFLIR
jgi:predicted RNase H-like HicB family nuclease